MSEAAAARDALPRTLSPRGRDLQGQPDMAQKFLAELSRRTAVMGAAWQSVGFVHGVLNTGAGHRWPRDAPAFHCCILRGR